MLDILIDKDYDLKFSGGDFLIGNSDQQHQRLILATNKGEWKETPNVGVGIETYLLDDGTEKLYAEMRKQLTMDGMTVNAIEVNNGKINIDGEYN